MDCAGGTRTLSCVTFYTKTCWQQLIECYFFLRSVTFRSQREKNVWEGKIPHSTDGFRSWKVQSILLRKMEPFYEYNTKGACIDERQANYVYLYIYFTVRKCLTYKQNSPNFFVLVLRQVGLGETILELYICFMNLPPNFWTPLIGSTWIFVCCNM